MKSKRNLLAIGTVVVICLVVARLAASIPDKPFDSASPDNAQGRGRTYEVEPQITTLPEYRTDAARAIDAYERLMERYMDLTEKHLLQVGGDCQTTAVKLDSLDSRLNEISARLARIEKALGIDPNGKASDSPRTLKGR
jgi:hypothetical protein